MIQLFCCLFTFWFTGNDDVRTLTKNTLKASPKDRSIRDHFEGPESESIIMLGVLAIRGEASEGRGICVY